MEKIIILMMQARTLLHTFHLQSDTLSKHLGLGALYESMSEHIDDIAECYQGLTGKLLELNSFPAFEVQKDDYAGQVREIHDAIERMRNEVTPMTSAIQNLIDEAQADMLHALYKLTFLK